MTETLQQPQEFSKKLSYETLPHSKIDETPIPNLGVSKEHVAILIPNADREAEIARLVICCQRISSHVFVCDDASKDLTGEIADRLGAVVLKHPVELGYWASLKTLLDYVESLRLNLKVICVLNDCAQFSHIESFIRPITTGECDVTESVVASFDNQSDTGAGMVGLRAFDAKFLSQLIEFDPSDLGADSSASFARMLNLRVKQVISGDTAKDTPVDQTTDDIYYHLRQRKVDVILTAYNDEEAIGFTVREFKSHPLVENVVVVDNNSSDATAAVAAEQGALVWRERKQGYGYACIGGLKFALARTTADCIALTEGDGTFLASDLEKMLPYLEDVDMVVGSRTSKELVAPDSQLDWFYIWGNLFIAKLMQFRFFDLRHLGRTRFTDVGCTYRVIKRKALASIINDLHIGGHHFSPHMTMTALSHQLRVIEIPVNFRKRIGKSKGAGGSHSLGFKVGLKMIWHVILGK